MFNSNRPQKTPIGPLVNAWHQTTETHLKLFSLTVNQGVTDRCRVNNSKTTKIGHKGFHDGHD